MNQHNFLEYFRIAWQSLTHRKKRAWLTIIGIFIGVMAVVALVSLGQGLEQGVDAEFSKLGVDKVFVMPASAFGGFENAPKPLTDNDLKRVQGTLGVKEAIGTNVRSAKIEWGDEVGFYSVSSYPLDSEEQKLFIESWQTKVVNGRQLEQGDTFKAIIGIDYTDRAVFQKTLTIGSSFRINNKTFTVVGIRERIGNPSDDRSVFIPQGVYEDTVSSAKDEFDMIIVRAQKSFSANQVAINLKKELQKERNVDPGDEDFTAQTAEDIRASADTILSIIQIVLTGISMISLIVGAVGIMNTMYTAVLERTKEIGIMKAVGATNQAIRTIFLIESGLLGLMGGLVGTVLGLLISFATAGIAGQALGTNLVQAYVSWWLVIGALGFSFVVGALAGYLPARQAANMKPVDSLRYE